VESFSERRQGDAILARLPPQSFQPFRNKEEAEMEDLNPPDRKGPPRNGLASRQSS
jgi:hypothetical protein